MVVNEIGSMILTDNNILITGESKKIRIWDTRTAANNPVEEYKQPAYSKVSLPDKWMGYKPVSNVTGFKYAADYKILAANFTGGNGIFTFDLRKRKPLDYFSYHYYPVSAFDMGQDYLKNVIVS